jgi:hypothetical protein
VEDQIAVGGFQIFDRERAFLEFELAGGDAPGPAPLAPRSNLR